jgi:hypothetical protein
MKLHRGTIFCLWIAATAQLFPLTAQHEKHAALVDLDFKTVQPWWPGNWDIGKGIADLIVIDLLRNRTVAVTGPQGASESVIPETILGVNAVIVGSSRQFGLEDNSQSGTVAPLGGFSGSNLNTRQGKASVVCTI